MNKYYKENEFVKTKDLLDYMPNNEFNSPFRSTVPLVCLFEKTNYLKDMVEITSDLKLVYEFETPAQMGVGQPSCSDLAIQTNSRSIIVEAKWTEPIYENVANWLGDDVNRTLVLNGWLMYINEYVQSDINIEDILDIPYQMVHRIASACYLNKEKSDVVYMGFDLNDNMKQYYTNNINKMLLLTNNKINIYLKNFAIIRKPKQVDLEGLWEAGERELSVDVKKGIIKNILMNFCELDAMGIRGNIIR